MAKASPVSWGQDIDANEFMKEVRKLGGNAIEFAAFFDPQVSGLAQYFKGKSREEINQWLRVEMYASVQAHEVGHTVGLRHNFGASMDPMNYKPAFWEEGYWNNPITAEATAAGEVNRGAEMKYASIMDYGFGVAQEVDDHGGRPCLHAHTAIHRKHLACDVGGFGAGKEAHCGRDIARCSKACHWYLRKSAFADFLVKDRSHIGLDKARGNDIDRDATAGDFAGYAFGHANKASFASGVVCLAGEPHESAHGADIDDAAGALFDHCAEDGAGEIEGAFEIGLEHDIPIVAGHAHGERVAGDACVVH
jgi:hypothetical protein